LTAIGQEPLKAKNYLKDQSKLLEENSEELFGDSFHKHVKDTGRAKESKEVLMKPKQRPLKNSGVQQQQTTLFEAPLNRIIQVWTWF